jgi:hypothetical protein
VPLPNSSAVCSRVSFAIPHPFERSAERVALNLCADHVALCASQEASG